MYSKDAILQYLKTKKGRNAIKCPVAGCNVFIEHSSLERDVDMERKLKKKKKKAPRVEEQEDEYTEI